MLGKRQFFSETNLQQASLIGYYESSGLGANYSSILEEKIKSVTVDKIQEVAKKYFDERYVLSIIAPKKHLERI